MPRYYLPQLIQFMKTYGKHKVLFGTNFPQLSFKECIEQVEALQLPEELGRLFLYENAKKVFRL